MADAVRIGDRIRFSVALLQQLHQEPEHRSRLVEIERIEHGPDGGLVLHLKDCEPAPARLPSRESAARARAEDSR